MKPSDRLEPNAEDFNNALKEFNSYIDVTLEDLVQINQLANKHAQLRQTEQLFVRDIMTRDVVTVNAETSLRDAASLLLDMRISGLPVVDQQDKLVGVVTEADFLSAMGIPSHHPAHSLWQTLETMFRHKPVENNMPDKVAEIMSQEIISLHADNNLHDVIDTMKRHHIKRVVITNEQQQVQGIITRSNLVRVLLQQML
jgi:CBS-domain-containing membrane protein